MEATFQSQIDEVLAATEELGGHVERITTRSEQLKEFDELARKALEERKLRHEEWKAWKPKPAPPTGVRLWPRQKNEPAPTESTMVAAYDLADIAVRQCVSKAEVARCSFKDKVTAQVDAISLVYQVITNAITKCLKLFAEDQQGYASNTSAGAARIVKVASDIFGSRIAGAFQETLASEAQGIPTESMPYGDLESISRYPTIESQPVILGFSLPPYYFSYTASTKFVVNVFCQLVSFIYDHEAWDNYANQTAPTDYSLAPTFRELERSWSGDEALNRDLLRSLGPSTCADLVKTLLSSFPEPLINCSEVHAENLRLWNQDSVHRPDTTWTGSIHQGAYGGMAIPPLVPPLYDRPQGEMLRVLCASLIPVFRGKPKNSQDRTCEIFSDLLTRKGECIKHAFPNLVREFSAIITTIDEQNAPPWPIFDTPRITPLRTSLLQPPGAMAVTRIPPTSASPLITVHGLPYALLPPMPPPTRSPTPLHLPPYPFPYTQSLPAPRLAPRPLPHDSTCPGWTAPDPEYPLAINDVESLKQGIVKTSRNSANVPYTILLIGETGVGKSLVLELIANVLLGKDIDHYDFSIRDRSNEQGVVGYPDRTTSPHLYEITSNSGILIRILDTPGLAGTHGLEQGELLGQSIVTNIMEHVSSISAVLVLTDSIVFTVSTDNVLSTLSTILPKSLANNIAFMFTDVPTPAFRDFSLDTVFTHAPQFALDNPIVLQKEYLHRQCGFGMIEDDERTTEDRRTTGRYVRAAEQSALEMLVRLFDWLDGLEPQPVMEIIRLYETYQDIEAKAINTLNQMDRALDREAEIDKLIVMFGKNGTVMNALPNFENAVDMTVSKQQPTTTRKIDKQELADQGMKKKWEAAKDEKERTAALIAVNELILHDLSHTINHSPDNLMRLVGRFVCLSLTGSFSVQVGRAVSSLEREYIAMEKRGVSQDKLEKVKRGLDYIRRKLELLNNAKENVQEESVE